jgi:hypothetical protein
MAVRLRLVAGLVGPVIMLATSSLAQAAPGPAAMQATLDAYTRLADLTVRVCVHPELFGYERSIGGRAFGEIAPSKLAKTLGDAKLGLDAGGHYHDWKGVSQQFLAGALKDSNGCSERLFSLMLRGLPLKDLQTGKPIPRSSGATVLYRPPTSKQPHSSEAVQQSATGGTVLQLNGNQNTVTFAPPPGDATTSKAASVEPDARVVLGLVTFWDPPGNPASRSMLGHLVNHGPGVAYFGRYNVRVEYSEAPLSDEVLGALADQNRLAVLQHSLPHASAIEKDEKTPLMLGDYPREGWDRMMSGVGYIYILVDFAYLDKKTPAGTANVAHLYERFQKDPASGNLLMINLGQDTTVEALHLNPKNPR